MLAFLLLVGCNSVVGVGTTPTLTQAPVESTAVPTDLPASPVPTVMPEPAVTAVLPTPVPTPLPPDLSITGDSVFIYPAPQIYTGDKVSFQVRPYIPPTVNPDDVTITVFVDGLEVGSSVLNDRDLDQSPYGLVKWAWETSNRAGSHQVQVFLDLNDTIQIGDENPNNNQISFPIVVYDRGQLPLAEANATWVMAETNCCRVHVVSGTAAYRDLPELLVEVETAVQQAANRLNETPQRTLDIYFIDRVIGQGGYAGSELVVSYLDRDYAGIELHQILVHELVHLLDQQFAPQRISFLAEGVAVWASDGHYKPEDIDQRAAALLELDRSVPLNDLINDFYPVQHEIGYLQAASFVKYLVDNFGWTRFRDFYSSATIDDAATPAQAVDMNLQIYYNQTLAQIEAEWLAYLNGLPWDEAVVSDLETTLYLYDTMRTYQQQYDPAAYFLTAWLPYPSEVRQTGTPADLTRHPEAEINVTLEVMLQAAGQNILDGDFNRASVILDSVNRVLATNGSFQDPLAENYRNIVHVALSKNYQVQRVNLSGEQADVWVTEANSTLLTRLTLTMQNHEWLLAN
ncbi:MAG: hypothetical protein H6669_07800 [Ardenticatenaceae bacterium]|nr:hypothetical protein [Ardenticatenaceae bacterium]